MTKTDKLIVFIGGFVWAMIAWIMPPLASIALAAAGWAGVMPYDDVLIGGSVVFAFHCFTKNVTVQVFS